MPQTYQQYQLTLVKLQQLAVNTQPGLLLRQILRQFEHILLEELGYAIDFSVDAHQQPVEPERHYHFQIQEGFIPVQKPVQLPWLARAFSQCWTMKKVQISPSHSYSYYLDFIAR